MDARAIARPIAAFGKALIAASLLSALIWWRAGLYFFAAGATVYGVARLIEIAYRAAPSIARE